MLLALEEHRQYLADAPRLAAFARAIAAVVRRGDIVLDLASGSGILGFLALQGGAARVYAVDNSPAIDLGRQLARANGLDDRITFIREFSTRVELPQRADVLVFDQLGPMGYQAGLFEFARDARRRLLTAEARIVPSAVDLYVAPVESAALRDRIDFWSTPVAGLDLRVVRALAANTAYTVADDGLRLLAGPALAAARTVGGDETSVIEAAVRLQVSEAGRLDGLCGWFAAQLAPGIMITNAPGAGGRINRRVTLLPLDPPVDVVAGDEVSIRLMIRPDEDQIAWQVEVTRSAVFVRRYRNSSFQGLLVPDETRQGADPGRRPRLTSLGEAQRTVLSLCDGTASLADIERTVLERHGAVLRDAVQAAVFVQDVIGASCR